MFCSCPVVDHSEAVPNSAVCPVCAAMPGALPVINHQAVEYALRVALALECQVLPVSIFARKNYFYPDLPKGYQISQYEQPLAINGHLQISSNGTELDVRIRRVHIEEDTGKLTHIDDESGNYSLIDLNRAGVPLLEIVSEPDLHTAAQVRAYATTLRTLLRYLCVNSGDMQKGVLRIEPNISVRPKGSHQLFTRTEIKNLNSFRALENSVAYEIARQIKLHQQGMPVIQQTLGWDESKGKTVAQRGKEEAHDYRYFPEPDLPPLVISNKWIEQVRQELPELPDARFNRFHRDYALNDNEASLVTSDPKVADFFEETVGAAEGISPTVVANWITGEIFAYLNQTAAGIDSIRINPTQFAGLIRMVEEKEINTTTAKSVLSEMLTSGRNAAEIVQNAGLTQISDQSVIAESVRRVLEQNPEQVETYKKGKKGLESWFFGQVMRDNRGKANPQIVKSELSRQLMEIEGQ